MLSVLLNTADNLKMIWQRQRCGRRSRLAYDSELRERPIRKIGGFLDKRK